MAVFWVVTPFELVDGYVSEKIITAETLVRTYKFARRHNQEDRRGP
jgi:hypothetical protein